MPKDPEKNSPVPDEEDEADTTNTKDVDSEESAAESSPDPAPRSKSARADRAPRREEEEDEEDEEERPRRRKKKKKKRAKRPLPTTEAEIDSPDMQTLWMLGSLAAMVLIMWGGARFACNAHPDETRKPREITTAEISSDPKVAATEVAQRWATRNFDGALELATGSLAAEIQQDKAKCETNPQCTGERQALKDKVLTTGELLQRLPASAVVRVTSTGTGDAPRSFVLEVNAPDGKTWKASAKKAADAPLPTPTDPTGMVPVPFAPTATAAATASAPAAPAAAASVAAPKKPAAKKPPAAAPAKSGP